MQFWQMKVVLPLTNRSGPNALRKALELEDASVDVFAVAGSSSSSTTPWRPKAQPPQPPSGSEWGTQPNVAPKKRPQPQPAWVPGGKVPGKGDQKGKQQAPDAPPTKKGKKMGGKKKLHPTKWASTFS